jgi:hypothetical protein
VLSLATLSALPIDYRKIYGKVQEKPKIFSGQVARGELVPAVGGTGWGFCLAVNPSKTLL